jgi:polyisoprenyl-phosphate glycosyltransferase
MSKRLISIVTPVYNEDKITSKFYEAVVQACSELNFELIFVDDGSADTSWQSIQKLSVLDKRVRGLQLSRNFGHQAALTAGIEEAGGEAIVILDCDLQDPPDLIPKMVEKWLIGYDIVYAVRTQRQGETFFKKITANLFYLIFRKISELNVPLDSGDFRLLSRSAVDVLKNMPERIRFLRGLTSWIGFKQTGINYMRQERFSGKTKFSLFRMIRLASDGITSFTSFPLQIATYMGLIVTSISFLVSMQALYVKFVTKTAIPGWTSLFSVIVFLGGIQLLMIGTIGEYVGRIYQEVKHRPVYLVRQKVGFQQK